MDLARELLRAEKELSLNDRISEVEADVRDLTNVILDTVNSLDSRVAAVGKRRQLRNFLEVLKEDLWMVQNG